MNLETLKNRRIIQWMLAYGGVFMVSISVLDPFVDAWDLPPVFERRAQALLVLGFIPAAILSWFHGEKGRQRAKQVEVALLVTWTLVTAVVLAAIAPTEATLDAPGVAAPIQPSGPQDRIRIAVMPVALGSNGTDEAGIARSIEDEIRGRLSQITSLRVVARESVIRHLGADSPVASILAAWDDLPFIVQSTLSSTADTVRLRVELLDTEAEELAWSRSFQSPYTAAEYYAMVVEVAERVAENIRARVTPGEQAVVSDVPTQDDQALRAYNQAVSLNVQFSLDENLAAGALLEGALQRDGDFFDARVFYAQVLCTRGRMQQSPEITSRGLSVAEPLIEEYPERAPAWMAVSFCLGGLPGNEERSAEAARAVLARNPSITFPWRVLGYQAMNNGFLAEAVGHAERSLDVWKEDGASMNLIGLAWMRVGDFDRAEYWFDAGIEGQPVAEALLVEHKVLNHRWNADAERARAFADSVAPLFSTAPGVLGEVALLALHQGRNDDLLEVAEQLHALAPRRALARGWSVPLIRALALSSRGAEAEAEALLIDLKEELQSEGGGRVGYWSEVELARTLVALGELDQATDLLVTTSPDGLGLTLGLEALAGRPEFDALVDRGAALDERRRRVLLESGLGRPPGS